VSLFTDQINIKDILAEEIRTVEAIFRTKREAMEPVIIAAAKKLEAYFDDHTKICTVLTKYFPHDADRDVRKYCPAKYKRMYILEEIN